MDETTRRLINCFATVFPDLDPQQITTASQSALGGWDSIAAITLVNVIEEEFGIELDLEIIGELDSFPAIRQHLGKRMQLA